MTPNRLRFTLYKSPSKDPEFLNQVPILRRVGKGLGHLGFLGLGLRRLGVWVESLYRVYSVWGSGLVMSIVWHL